MTGGGGVHPRVLGGSGGAGCVVVGDDLLASGATLGAAAALVAAAGCAVAAAAVPVELPDHGGRAALARAGVPRVVSLLQYPSQ